MQRAIYADIKARDLRFPRGGNGLAKDWNGGDAFRTAFFNSMSILFPIGEKTFIDSVMAHQGAVVDPRLSADVKGFIAQESVHRREHQRFNQDLCAARGYDLEYLEKRIKDSIAADQDLEPILLLASTVAYEHFTATLAHCLLTEESWLTGADTEVANMWRWHAVEEIEHKSVAFEVYLAAGGTRSMLRTVIVYMSWEFLVRYMARNVRYMLAHDRPPLWPTLKSGLTFMLGKRGFFRSCWKQYWRFFRSDFHPNNIDERQLTEWALKHFGIG